jgi:hypothetical protein
VTTCHGDWCPLTSIYKYVDITLPAINSCASTSVGTPVEIGRLLYHLPQKNSVSKKELFTAKTCTCENQMEISRERNVRGFTSG